jgi:hypothetical protein
MMTSPLNYRGGRQFPQSILDDLDARLGALESAASPQANADTPAKLARDAVRMLEGYAASYDAMARDPKGNGSVDCRSVAQDIRANMAGWFGAHLAEQVTATQPAQTDKALTKRAPTAWQPIETAPKTGLWVTLFARYPSATAGAPHFGYFDPSDGKWYESGFLGRCEIIPSHWMARPEFPAAPQPASGGAEC